MKLPDRGRKTLADFAFLFLKQNIENRKHL